MSLRSRLQADLGAINLLGRLCESWTCLLGLSSPAAAASQNAVSPCRPPADSPHLPEALLAPIVPPLALALPLCFMLVMAFCIILPSGHVLLGGATPGVPSGASTLNWWSPSTRPSRSMCGPRLRFGCLCSAHELSHAVFLRQNDELAETFAAPCRSCRRHTRMQSPGPMRAARLAGSRRLPRHSPPQRRTRRTTLEVFEGLRRRLALKPQRLVRSSRPG